MNTHDEFEKWWSEAGWVKEQGYEKSMAEDAFTAAWDIQQNRIPQWIPVSERLPEDKQEVLTIDADRNVEVYYFRKSVWEAWGVSAWGVSHWMPLPPLPEDE